MSLYLRPILQYGGKNTVNIVVTSGNGFGVYDCIHLHGCLFFGGLHSRATDLGFGIVFICMGAYSLVDYSLGRGIWDLELYSFGWVYTVWGIESRTTDLASGIVSIAWGPTE